MILDVRYRDSWKTVETQKSFISCSFLVYELLIPRDLLKQTEPREQPGNRNFISGRKLFIFLFRYTAGPT